MRRWLRALTVPIALSLPVALAAALGAHVAIAHARPNAAGKTEVDRTTVDEGDVLLYSISVTTDGDESPARTPVTGNLDGFESLGSSTSTHESIVMSGGGVERRTTITVTYRLRAKTIGVHVLGPGKMYVDGEAVKTPSVTVSVVTKGTAPKKKPQSPDPFFDDPFFGGGGGQEEEEPTGKSPEILPVDPMAGVTELPSDPAERRIFVRLVPDEVRPVIGQQVTAKLFVYTRRQPRISVKRPPAFPEFATVDLGQLDHEWHPITIGGEQWAYANIGGYAAFPLKTGALTIGAAQIEYSEPFSPGGPRDLDAKEVTVQCVEPPLTGRPPAYVLGDVASELEAIAEISPREVVDGHALLTLRMRGRGRLEPLRPILPALPGVTWTATGDDAKTDINGTAVHGMRKLSFDVAFDQTGGVDLGDALVHVWDPRDKAYVTVKAPLGRVRVGKAVSATVASAAPLSQLPAPRTEPGDSGAGASLADIEWTWGLAFGSPFAVVFLQGAARLVRRARARAAEGSARPESQAEVALREARAAEKKGDAKGAASAMTRAIDRALEAATGVRARGLTSSELDAALAETKLERGLASRVAALLSALESARFADGALPKVTEASSIVDALKSGSA